jgi:hypothetical protein
MLMQPQSLDDLSAEQLREMPTHKASRVQELLPHRWHAASD